MTSSLVALCVDAMDPAGQARFWSAALHWEIERTTWHHHEPAEIGVARPDGGFRMLFVPARTRRSAKNPVHLDLSTTSLDDQREAVENFIELGAAHVFVGQRPDESHVVLADPEGNEFCVLEPGNSFVDQRSRFGSITCDGSPAVGRFWSAALNWPLVWEQHDETAVGAPDGTGPFVTWGGPIPARDAERRLHFDVAPVPPADHAGEVRRLLSLGATAVGEEGNTGRVVMTDPDGNFFCVIPLASK